MPLMPIDHDLDPDPGPAPTAEDTLRSCLEAIAGRREDLACWIREHGRESRSAEELAAGEYSANTSGHIAALQARLAEQLDFTIAARTAAKIALSLTRPNR